MLSFEKLTIKAQEAMQSAQRMATDNGQQQIEQIEDP